MTYPALEGVCKSIDYALLRPNASEEDVIKACEESKVWHFAAFCIHPFWLPLVEKHLRDSDVRICSVVGFPLGLNTTRIKIEEGKEAIDLGAQELDVVANLGLLKSGDLNGYIHDVRAFVESCKSYASRKGKECLVKVIIECAYLSPEEIRTVSSLLKESRADFLKTSTGFGPRGATLEDVRIMKEAVGDAMRIKVAGGIRKAEEVLSFLSAGAHRIGTSHAVEIAKEYKALLNK